MMKAPFFAGEMGNMYVADMNYHQALDNDWQGTFLVENAAAIGNNTLMAATTVASAGVLNVDIVVDPNGFGRNLRVLSTDAGDATFHGVDYLNQPMSETITCTIGTVEGAKAFKKVTKIVSVAVDGDIAFGPGAEMGIPFCGVEVIRELVDGSLGTDGALTAPDTATPSATTGDVRGTYDPNFTEDGAKDVQVTLAYTNGLTGGLYGQRQA